MLTAASLLLALRLNYDAVLPVPVCMPLFLAHQAISDMPAPRLARAAWVAINLPCGDF